MDQPLSPLEPLDPHRLRDMVVDKQTPQSTASSTIGHQMAHQWTTNQTASPASVGSPHSIVNQRSSTGSVEMNSPFQAARPPSQQPNSTSHNYDFNAPRTPMYQSGSSPTKPLAQQHMMSPHSNHPPASPFNRSSSAASNNPSSSPYPQVPPQYPGVSSPMYPPASAYPVRLPPSYPAPTGPNPQQVPTQYVTYPNGPQQWPPQTVLPQYPNQPAGQRMMATGQRTMITRVPYVQQGYPTGMPPPNTMYPPRTPRQPVVQYPRTATVPSTPQTPATSTTTPTNGGTQFPGQYPQPHYYIPQQQRLQQQRQQSPIRSPFVAQQSTNVHPSTPQPQAPSTPMTHPNTPGGSSDRTKMAVRFGAQQQSSGPQTPCPSTPSSQPQDHGPQTPGTPLQQQRLAHASGTGIQNSTPHAAQVPIMRSPPLVGPAQAAQMPPVGQHHALIRPQAPLPQQPIHPQQQSVDIARRMMHHPTTPGTPIAGQRNGAPIYAQHPAVQQQRIAAVQPIGIHPANAMMQRIPGVQPATRLRPPQYYGQFFNGQQQQTNPETFLAGCCFVIEDISLLGYDKHELESRLRYYGAEVEHNLNAIHEPPQVPFYGAPVPASRVTHILCDTLTMKIRQQVLRFTLPQRLVTSHWLSWCLEKRKLEPPTRACHLPTPWAEDKLPGTEKLPGTDKLLTAEGFNESELACIRVMCKAIGARFTTYMTRKHAALISKTGEGPKAEKTREWKIPILNYGWLMRLYFGNVQMINEINRDIHKPPGDPQFQVDSTPYVLERISEFPLKLLIPWRAPIVVTEEALRLATQTREKIVEDLSIFPHKKLLMDPLPAPTDEQIEEATRILMENSRIPNVRVFIDGLPQTLKETSMRKVRFMGGQEADSIIACTHFVTTSLKRTPALLEALARGKEVVDPAWINHSYSRVHFVDSFDFHVRDAENERKFRFSALNTIYRARERAIFEDMTIHLSPSVLPSYEVLRTLIEAGGGVVEKEKPKFKKIAECIRYDKTFLIVVNDADAISYGHFYAKRIPLFNEEFILMSILRHRVDTGLTYRLNPPLVDTPRPSPAKFVRTPQQRPVDRIKLAAMFTGVEDTILVRRHGQVGGEQFVIADCQNSILLVLDHVPSVTIDDCKNCVIVVGPCSGSVFVRDCTDCTIFAACQQFRCRDATISVHLFCTTEPVVEDTTATITRLNIKYPFLEEQMETAGLLGKDNQYDQVRDFTPDTSKISVAANVPAFDLKNLLPKLNLIEIVASSKSPSNVQSQGRRFSIGADSDGEVENIVGQLLEEVNLDEPINENPPKDQIDSSRRSSKEEEGAETRRSTATVSSTSYSRYGAEVLWRHHGATEVETTTDNQSKTVKAKRPAPVYTFEEFLRCSPSDDSDEEDEPNKQFNSKAANSLNHTFAFYDNPALEADNQIAHSSSTYQSINPFDSDWPGEVNSPSQSQHFVGHWKNGNGNGGDDRIGFYVLNDRQQTRPSNQNSNSLDQRLRTALTNRSVSSATSTLASSARPSATGAPRILCASSLTTEQIDEKPPDFEEPQRDQLHPVLQSSPGSILRDLLCCRSTDPPEQEEIMSGSCWKALGSCFTRESGGRENRAERYQMAETDPTAAPRQFSWDRERPSAANYKFTNAIDATLVKRRGDVSGQQFIIENCQNSTLMVLDSLGSVTVDDCKSCVIILGPCSGSVFVRDCSDCTIFTVCQQFRSRDCSIMIHLFCATSPIIEETTAQFFPLFLKYPFIEENMNQSGLSPFTNYWYKVHDFTPETSQFTISQTPKPIENTYGPAHNWLPDLKAERLSIDSADSYFLFTPPTRSLETNEETILLLFNRPLKTEQPDKSSFYSTVISVIHRLCADPQLTRLVVSHDLDIREGKLISVELTGPVDDCRQFVERILGPINYPGIFIQIVKPIETEIYRQNLNRLADVQSNI